MTKIFHRALAAGAMMFIALSGHAGNVNGDGRTGLPDHPHAKRYGVTTLSVNYMREAPDFTAELGSQALLGTPVEILDTAGYWLKIRTPDPYTAWCVDLGIMEMSEQEMRAYIAAEKVICTADYSTVTERPRKPEYSEKRGGTKGGNRKICDIVLGDVLLDKGKSIRGYRQVMLPSGVTGYVRKKDVEQYGKWKEERDPSPDNIIRTAMRFLGVPYFWGGTSIKGVDCSGLVRMVWYLNGVSLPRNASQQAKAGMPVEVECGVGGKTDTDGLRREMLSRIRNLEKGDLVFFGTRYPDGQSRITHVGIYIGGGRFIHASKYVRINSLIPGEKDFYELSWKFIKARRISYSRSF